ncbi:hypothetical protein EDB87DRAFT_1653010 [Lactarius vividus]|nr:hypothetical protein EDB87DRAFT_1653010 [Lactarius vividus]
MSANAYLRSPTTTTNATASASATAAPLCADYGAYTHGFDLLSEPLVRLGPPCLAHTTYVSASRLTRLVLTGSKALTNASSIPSPPTNDIGGHINTPHAHEALASNLVSTGSANARNLTDHIHRFYSRTFFQTLTPLAPSKRNKFPVHHLAGMESISPR